MTIAKLLSSLFVAASIVVTPVSAVQKENNNEKIQFLNDKPAKTTLPFSEAVQVGGTLYLSGPVAIKPKTGKRGASRS